MKSVGHIRQYPPPERGLAVKTMQAIAQQQAGQPEAPHRHQYYTIIWVQEGSGTHLIDFKEYRVRPQMLYFVSPEQVHSLAMSEGHGGYVLLFSAEFVASYAMQPEMLQQLDLFFNCNHHEPLAVPAPSGARLAAYVQAMQHELAGQEVYTQEALGAWLRLFLLECRRMKWQQQGEPTDSEGPKIVPLVKEFKRLVEANFRQIHKVGDYAERLHVTANYLNEVFKAETGYSAKAFIQERLTVEAKHLARFGHLSSKAVAYQLGFDDPAHFSKFFKNCTGANFSQYRQQAGLLPIA